VRTARWTEALRRRLGRRARPRARPRDRRARRHVAPAPGFDVRTADLDDRWPFARRLDRRRHANQVIEHVQRLDHFVAETKRNPEEGRLRIRLHRETSRAGTTSRRLLLGYQPFSATNVSSRRPIGNPFALARRRACPGGSLQHVHVITPQGAARHLPRPRLRDRSRLGVRGTTRSAGGVAAALARIDPNHAHFIAVVARRA
jgi:hypothetical protein